MCLKVDWVISFLNVNQEALFSIVRFCWTCSDTAWLFLDFVNLLDIDYEKLECVKKEIEEYTNDVLIYDCDVSNEEKVSDVIKDAEEKFGRIDILVNNAALWRGTNSFVNIPTDVWRKFIDINVMEIIRSIYSCYLLLISGTT